MNHTELYKKWKDFPLSDKELVKELCEIEGNEEKIYERFCRELEFGTGGLRGIIGAGTNRMNVYTVKKATQGFAEYILSKNNNPSVAISHDSRINSRLFAESAAEVFAANGIHVYIYKELMPTPMLSFAVRELGCAGGVMITASHNPSVYNGYKAYNKDGCQLGLCASEEVMDKIKKIDVLTGHKSMPFSEGIENGTISYITDDVPEKFYSEVLNLRINKNAIPESGLKVVYTPLCGTGNKPVREVLNRAGLKNITVVKCQENPDGNFTTCPYPNPEFREALTEGLSELEKTGGDILIATDPDCDRVGTAIIKDGEVKLLSGNDIGVLLLWYLFGEKKKNGTLPPNPLAVKTIVSTPLADRVVKHFGGEVIDVLTGFKFIGEQIKLLEDKGETERYILGFEESYGYLCGSYVRDKDGVMAALLVSEMAAYYKMNGRDLLSVLGEINEMLGYFRSSLQCVAFSGADAMKIMADKMAQIRKNPPKEIDGEKVVKFSDYLRSVAVLGDGREEKVMLPVSDVLSFETEKGNSVIIRPSGTEPKIKIYYTGIGKNASEAEEKTATLRADFTKTASF